ncbi:MAG: response regulator transcription factor, partial [Anaerolineales bacterium]
MSEPISVLIVDDHPVVRQGIRMFLETQADIAIVGEAASGREALLIVQKYVPDVAIVDLVLPEMSGVEVTHQIRRISPRTQVVVLTSYDEDRYIFPALQAGAISYILKDVT